MRGRARRVSVVRRKLELSSSMATAEVAAENNSEKFALKQNCSRQPTITTTTTIRTTLARLKQQARVLRVSGLGKG